MTSENVKIVYYKKARKKTTAAKAGHWSETKKMEVLTHWMASGNLSQAAQDAGVPYDTAMSWRRSEWWKDKQRLIESEEFDKFDKRLTKAIDKALDSLMDRIENGESIYDPKTGGVIRMPAKLRDLNVAFNTVMDKRQILRKQPTKIVEQQTTASQLQDLAAQFAQFVQGSVKNPKEVEYVQEAEFIIENGEDTETTSET